MIDMTGKRFGRLAVLRLAERIPGKGDNVVFKWECQCDCGNTKLVNGSNLRRGLTKSCGCFNREATSARCKGQARTHGMTYTAEFKIWQGMRQRCENPNDKDFLEYGGRGLRVCERWQSFENFFADMGPRPSNAHSIDRIFNHLGYTPANCRWATHTEQNRNKRKNLVVSAFGKTGPLAMFIPETHSPEYQRARKRIKAGMDAERAISEATASG